jgi:SOS-response transcriptional repressor LexA
LINKLNFNPAWLETGEGEILNAPLPKIPKNNLMKSPAGYTVPLLRQRVSCGEGADWETEDNIADNIDIFSVISRLNLVRPFAMRAQGTSMLGAGIEDGDYVIFNAGMDQHLIDDIYVVALDDELFCKRLEFDRFSKKIKIY